MSTFQPREGQLQILEYEGGRMGVSAVPGSGKTSTIAVLAARLVERGLPGRGKVLVVTYQNAAVDHLRTRIREELAAKGRLQVGCDVRTLHSLSHGLVRAHPSLAGVEADFQVLDERASYQLLDKAVRLWNSQNTRIWGRLGPDEYYGESWEQEWQRLATQLARTVISTAKNRRLKPEALLERLGEGENQFLRIGAQIYQLYQQQLQTIGGLDFDDLVWMAVELLEANPELCARLRRRWPMVLEDEAQDSVPLQEALLGLLSGPGGNWIRVGGSQPGHHEHLHRCRSAFFAPFSRRGGSAGHRDGDLWPLRPAYPGPGQPAGGVDLPASSSGTGAQAGFPPAAHPALGAR